MTKGQRIHFTDEGAVKVDGFAHGPMRLVTATKTHAVLHEAGHSYAIGAHDREYASPRYYLVRLESAEYTQIPGFDPNGRFVGVVEDERGVDRATTRLVRDEFYNRAYGRNVPTNQTVGVTTLRSAVRRAKKLGVRVLVDS